MDPLSNESSIIGENHLTSLAIVLKTYSKWGNIYLRKSSKLSKNSQSLWHLKPDLLSLSLFLSLFLPLPSVWWKLHSRQMWLQMKDLNSPQLPIQKLGILLRRVSCWHFSFPSSLRWRDQILREVEGYLPHPFSAQRMQAPSQMCQVEIPGAQLPLCQFTHICKDTSSVGKKSTCSASNLSSISGSGRSPGGGIGYPLQCSWASLVAQLVKESACNVGDLDSIPGLGRSPGEGKGYPLQYSGLEKSMDCIVHGVTKSRTWLVDFHFHDRRGSH